MSFEFEDPKTLDEKIYNIDRQIENLQAYRKRYLEEKEAGKKFLINFGSDIDYLSQEFIMKILSLSQGMKIPYIGFSTRYNGTTPYPIVYLFDKEQE